MISSDTSTPILVSACSWFSLAASAYGIFYSQAAEDIADFLAGEPVRVLQGPDPAS